MKEESSLARNRTALGRMAERLQDRTAEVRMASIQRRGVVLISEIVVGSSLAWREN
jgi:hypothetical protein